jgi:endonuclease/exonuclease/phosphatase family metal-dependent hydrolase
MEKGRIKVMWYNVLRGFHKKELNGFTFEPERLKAVKRVVATANPDILFIGEGDFNPKCKIKGERIKTIDYQKEFNYPYFYYSEPDETSRKGEVILSKIPFVAENLSEGNYSTTNYTNIKASFNINNKKVNLNIVHPYPTISEDEKAKFIKKVLAKSKNPYLLLGDFNALSPEDKYKEEELFKLFYLFSKDKEAALNNVKGSIQTLMIKEIIKHGLIDTFKAKNKCQVITLPTKKYSPFDDKPTGIRLDYIFCSKDFNVVESGIIQNKLADIASDHYPIYADLELK